jgi:hypothetical protein
VQISRIVVTTAIPALMLLAGIDAPPASAAEPDISLSCKLSYSEREKFVRIFLSDRKIEIEGVFHSISDVASDRIASEGFVEIHPAQPSLTFKTVWTIYRSTLKFEIKRSQNFGDGSVSYDIGECRRATAQF